MRCPLGGGGGGGGGGVTARAQLWGHLAPCAANTMALVDELLALGYAFHTSWAAVQHNHASPLPTRENLVHWVASLNPFGEIIAVRRDLL